MKNKGYAKFFGENKVHYQKCGSGVLNVFNHSSRTGQARLNLQQSFCWTQSPVVRPLGTCPLTSQPFQQHACPSAL